MLNLWVPERNEIVDEPRLLDPICSRLVSYSMPWADVSPHDFLERMSGGLRVYWENEQEPLAFAGHGVAATLVAEGRDRFRTIREDAERLFADAVLAGAGGTPEAGPRLFGGFAFRARSECAAPSEDYGEPLWSAFADAFFVLPRYLLTRSQGRSWLTANRLIDPGEDLDHVVRRLQEEIRALPVVAGRSFGNGAHGPGPADSDPAAAVEDLMDRDTWRRLVGDATRRIRLGEMDKVVLARARRIRTGRVIRPLEVLARLQRRYPGCFRFLFEPAPGHAFFGATPELLGKVVGRHLHTVALAGSIGRGDTPEEDQALGRRLFGSPKERWEHSLVVRTVVEGLRPLVSHLEVPAEPQLYSLSNIQHLRTPIQGKLRKAGGILSVVEALHPTPAVGGVAREAALDHIRKVEPTPRGWYAGPVGWIDRHGNGLFAVAIRSAVNTGHESMLFSGAGIVADSVPEREWEETQLKFKPLQEALGGGEVA